MFSNNYKIVLDAMKGCHISSVLIQLLGLLPEKNLTLKLFEIPNSGNLLVDALPELIEEINDKIK